MCYLPARQYQNPNQNYLFCQFLFSYITLLSQILYSKTMLVGHNPFALIPRSLAKPKSKDKWRNVYKRPRRSRQVTTERRKEREKKGKGKTSAVLLVRERLAGLLEQGYQTLVYLRYARLLLQ